MIPNGGSHDVTRQILQDRIRSLGSCQRTFAISDPVHTVHGTQELVPAAIIAQVCQLGGQVELAQSVQSLKAYQKLPAKQIAHHHHRQLDLPL